MFSFILLFSQTKSIAKASATRFQTTLPKIHSTKRWTTYSPSALYKGHKLGPIEPRLQRLSQEIILFINRSQLKHFILMGILKFNNSFQNLSYCRSKVVSIIYWYASFVVTCPLDSLNDQTHASSFVLSLIPKDLKEWMYVSHYFFQSPPNSSSSTDNQISLEPIE